MKRIFLFVVIEMMVLIGCGANKSEGVTSSSVVLLSDVKEEQQEEEEYNQENEEKLEMQEKNEGEMLDGEIIDECDTTVPEEIQVSLKYDSYFINYDYVVANGGGVNIREGPSTDSKIVRRTARYEKINLLETVSGEYLPKYDNNKWCHVYWWNGEGEKQFGFVYSEVVEVRTFRFDKMFEELIKIENEVQGAQISYINNYKNRVGEAPLCEGKEFDQYGTRRYQSAPGYIDLSNKGKLVYIEDGTLVKIHSKSGGYYKVKVLKSNLTLFVEEKYLRNSKRLSQLTKVIIIDRKNQNEGVFEKIEGQWVLTSYTLATTGARAEHKLETPTGYYFAIEKKDKFLYLNDITKEISGYAPYAIRFTGGTYIHGVPVQYKKSGNKIIDPGHIEYTGTIGTLPLSHRCVRNYTSHAKFLYEWVDIKKTLIIVIE